MRKGKRRPGVEKWEEYKEFMGELEGEELSRRIQAGEPLQEIRSDLEAKRPERNGLRALWRKEREG